MTDEELDAIEEDILCCNLDRSADITGRDARRLIAEVRRLRAELAKAQARDSLGQLQRHQPWTVPYSSRFETASGAIHLPHLPAVHAVLHAMKSLGKIATILERLDHREACDPSPEERTTVRSMSADLLTISMRLANLFAFDLGEALLERQAEKNPITGEVVR